jgi:hypothetical protein
MMPVVMVPAPLRVGRARSTDRQSDTSYGGNSKVPERLVQFETSCDVALTAKRK